MIFDFSVHVICKLSCTARMKALSVQLPWTVQADALEPALLVFEPDISARASELRPIAQCPDIAAVPLASQPAPCSLLSG